MGINQTRRELIALLAGTAATLPTAARTQQSTIPVIGLLSSGSPEEAANSVATFRQALREAGYVESQNLIIEYRFARFNYDRLPELAADLVRRQVSVIVAANGTPAAVAAKAATGTIPIVFRVGEDPVKNGLVASLSRPGGNVTGINFFTIELAEKRLGFLRELLPGVTRVALLVNPAANAVAQSTVIQAEATARAIGLQIRVLNATTEGEIDAAFASLLRERADALLIHPNAFLFSRREQIAALAARQKLPAIYDAREWVEAGGLISYGASGTYMYRQLAAYSVRILKGAKPADLPVEQSTTFELVINLKAAKAIGLDVPASLLARADEVIE